VPVSEPILLSAPLELKATDDAKLPTRFGGVAYSGGLVPGMGVVIDLASTRFNARIPILLQHDHEQPIGVADAAAIQNNQLVIGGRLFSDMTGSPAERVAMLAQRGMPYEMSVGIFDFNVERVPAGKSAAVNGATFQGPVTVLRSGAVREVSVVTLGADPETDAQFFNRRGDAMNVELLTARVAELEAQLAAAQPTDAALLAARSAGAQAERERIQAVEAATLPGHEALIASLKFDGKTSGGDAALAVNSAERALRAKASATLASESPQPLKPSAAPTVELSATDPMADHSKPIEERCKAKWDSDAKVRAEFTSLAAFTAMAKAEEAGKVRVLKTRAAA
jgi:hypothetical protein